MSPTPVEKFEKWLDRSDPRSVPEWQARYESKNYSAKELQTKNRRHSEKETEAIGNFATNMLIPIARDKADRELYRTQNKRVASGNILREKGIPKERSAYNETVSFVSGTTKLIQRVFKW